MNGGYEGAHSNWYPIPLQGGALSYGHDCHSVAGDHHHITGQFGPGEWRAVGPHEAVYAQTHNEVRLRGTLTAGDHKLLSVRTYMLTLVDRSWPNNSVVEFEYASDEPNTGSRWRQSVNYRL